MSVFPIGFPNNATLWAASAFALITWAIIVYKWWQYFRFKSKTSAFLHEFWKSADLAEARDVSERRNGALARLTRIGFTVLDTLNSNDGSEDNLMSLHHPRKPEAVLKRSLRQEIEREIGRMETGLPLMAALGMTVPFVGLFGTLWHIHRTLKDVSIDGTESLANVTASIDAVFMAASICLAAAFSAGLGAYYFFRRLRRTRSVLENFAEDFVDIARDSGFNAPRRAVAALEIALENAEPAPTDKHHSYGQILKSSALIGGSSVINIAIGIVRTKAMAVLLGPAGFGLMGLYGSITDLAQSIASMGINSSGVRQIAEAVGSGETERIARTATVLRRISIVLGLLGGALLILFSDQASTLTFGDDRYSGAVALLSLSVFFRCVSAGQGALIQGMRRIADLAKMGILGTLAGTVISIPLVYFFGQEGVVPSLIGIAATGVLTSWWYSRKIKVHRPSLSITEVRQEAAALLKLGFAFMASGLMMMGATYAIRVLIVRNLGLEAAGFYQSAWALGGLYVGFILDAMGADFYPRLTAVAKDNAECNRLVNEQAHVSLLLAGPGVIATISLAPLVIALFYSTKFYAAVDVLRWLCLGMALRILSWPMGFIILAKGAQRFFFWSEAAWTVVYLALAWVCVDSFGLNGAGIAFFGSYIFHVLMVVLIVRRLSGFRWSVETKKASFFFIALLGLVFWATHTLPPVLGVITGTLVAALSGVYSVRVLIKLVSPDRIPRRILTLLAWLHLADPGPASA